VGTDRTASAGTAITQSTICGAEAHSGSRGANGHPLRPSERATLEHAAEGDGMRVRHGLLATPGGVASGRRVAAAARGVADRTAPAGPTRSGARRGGQRLGPRAARGKKTGPNPTDRRKAGSKHHLLTEAHGIPLVAQVTAANRNDITVLLEMVDAIPPLRGRPGPPRRRPRAVQGDRGYDSNRHRAALIDRGITPMLARRFTAHGSGLGKTRWVVERTLAWLHRYRRLAVRYERLDYVHEAFLVIGCALVCWNFLKVVI